MKFVSTIISERRFGFSPCQHLFSQARHIGLPGRHLWDISGHEKFNADADCKQNIYGLIQATNWEVLRLNFFKHSRHTLMNFSIPVRRPPPSSSFYSLLLLLNRVLNILLCLTAATGLSSSKAVPVQLAHSAGILQVEMAKNVKTFWLDELIRKFYFSKCNFSLRFTLKVHQF